MELEFGKVILIGNYEKEVFGYDSKTFRGIKLYNENYNQNVFAIFLILKTATKK